MNMEYFHDLFDVAEDFLKLAFGDLDRGEHTGSRGRKHCLTRAPPEASSSQGWETLNCFAFSTRIGMNLS